MHKSKRTDTLSQPRTRQYTHSHACTHTRAHARTHAYACLCAIISHSARALAHTCARVCRNITQHTRTRTHTHIHIHTHTQKRRHTHTHTHTHTQTQVRHPESGDRCRAQQLRRNQGKAAHIPSEGRRRRPVGRRWPAAQADESVMANGAGRWAGDGPWRRPMGRPAPTASMCCDCRTRPVRSSRSPTSLLSSSGGASMTQTRLEW
jgi:hypothetical protein